MTAPGGGGADEIREQLARWLWKGVQEASWATGVAMLDSDVAAFSERLAADLLPTVQALIAQAEERGRQSVGLCDFLPGGCDDEVRAPNYHFTETYGDWLECTRRKGHDGDHEHEDSGLTWPRALDGTP